MFLTYAAVSSISDRLEDDMRVSVNWAAVLLWGIRGLY